MPTIIERFDAGLFGGTGPVSSLGFIPLIFAIGLYAVYQLYARVSDDPKRHRRLPLPPGPSRLPLVGNLFNAPGPSRWLTHLQWRSIYGPLTYLNVLGKPIIVLTTVESAHDLLNKKAGKYSGRPYSVIGGHLLSKGYNMFFRQYDSQHRIHTRLHIRSLNVESAALYRPIHELESLQLVHDLIEDGRPAKESDYRDIRPVDPTKNFHRGPASSLNVILYGSRLVKGDVESDKQIDFFYSCPTTNIMQKETLVDIFPSLTNIPRAISPWKRRVEPLFRIEAAHHVNNLRAALARPGYNVAKQIVSSSERLDTGMSETELAWVVGTLYLANGETSPNILSWFVVAMQEHPDAMRKAHASLDDVVGRERCPTYEDRTRLPYIDALIEECMRWRPVIPGGLDHAALEDDEYMGYRIPKGANVSVSQWALTRDEAVFGKDCDAFRPERWLEDKNLPNTAFGYGRRTCPGRHLARESLWIFFARLLWAFEFEHSVDPVTKEKRIFDTMEYLPFGVGQGPLEIEAIFRPRGKWVEEIAERDVQGIDGEVEKIKDSIGAAKGV
ncbi:Fumitremorgin C synthase [Colletotrichum trifolii]|uniref:Fumitremorgin C synthase n=1 Tax=Colletotrichum trifolii TaxID=5466 RepID=A0A4R8RXG3_COLTR|nr:Fumitremorgin C synthase [Colletotrichum trifolii]